MKYTIQNVRLNTTNNVKADVTRDDVSHCVVAPIMVLKHMWEDRDSKGTLWVEGTRGSLVRSYEQRRAEEERRQAEIELFNSINGEFDYHDEVRFGRQ